jgi:hypothetical protein
MLGASGAEAADDPVSGGGLRVSTDLMPDQQPALPFLGRRASKPKRPVQPRGVSVAIWSAFASSTLTVSAPLL